VVGEARELWLGLGKSYADFWTATPFEATKVITALQKYQHRNIVMAGWYTEYFARQKRLKGLSHYLDEPKTMKPLKKGEAMQAGPWLALMGAGSGDTI